MADITIQVEVVNGQLCHDSDLSELEGRRIVATLTPEMAGKSGSDGDFDLEPPDGMDVEKDLYFAMQTPSISLGKLKVNVTEGKPCIILSEELPDE